MVAKPLAEARTKGEAVPGKTIGGEAVARG